MWDAYNILWGDAKVNIHLFSGYSSLGGRKFQCHEGWSYRPINRNIGELRKIIWFSGHDTKCWPLLTDDQNFQFIRKLLRYNCKLAFSVGKNLSNRPFSIHALIYQCPFHFTFMLLETMNYAVKINFQLFRTNKLM